jgi:hypothetical protein
MAPASAPLNESETNQHGAKIIKPDRLIGRARDQRGQQFRMPGHTPNMTNAYNTVSSYSQAMARIVASLYP